MSQASDTGKGKLVLEVQDHIGNNWVRCLSLAPTEGLARGIEVVDTGLPITVPVGRGCLGRLFDVSGTAIDNAGPVKATDNWPIHRPAPSFEDQETAPQLLETGLKVIDLVAPFSKGGKVGAYGAPVSVKLSLSRNLSVISLPSTAASQSLPVSGNVPAKATISGTK